MTKNNIIIQRSYKNKHFNGFTIVELLVVIVVIGILAAITIVSYSGISRRANIASLESDLSSNSKLLKMYYAEYGFYPTSIDGSNCPTAPTVNTNYCLRPSKDTTLTYISDGSTFKLIEKKSGISYYITNDSQITAVTVPVVANNTATSLLTTSAVIGASVIADGGSAITSYGVCYGLTVDPTNCSEIEVGSLTAKSPATMATPYAQKKIVSSPDGLYVYSLASSDADLRMYSRDPITNTLTILTPATIATGNMLGKDLVTSPDGKFMYAISTNSSSSVEIYMFSRNATNGLLAALSPASQFVWSGGGGTTEMAISPDGKNIYVCHDGYLYTYTVNISTGLLTQLGSRANLTLSREIAISPDGLYAYIAVVDASNEGIIKSFTRNTTTGALTFSSNMLLGNNVMPDSIAISGDGNYLYANIPAANIIRQFSRNKTNGQLTALTPVSVSATSTTGLEISADDKNLYAAGGNVKMFKRDVVSGLLSALNPPTASLGGAEDVYLSPDDKAIYAVSSSSIIGLFNRSTEATEGSTFSKRITGLTSGTTYYYRGYATNSAGTGYSTSSTFTTP